MTISRAEISRLFLKDAERSKELRAEALNKIPTAKGGGGRVLETVAGAGAGFLTGGPVGAITGGLSAATGKGDVLESAIGSGVTGLTSKATLGTDIPKALETFSKVENIPKIIPLLRQAGVPDRIVKPLETFSATQKKAGSFGEKSKLVQEKAESKRKEIELRSEKRLTEIERRAELTKIKGTRSSKAKLVEKGRTAGLKRYDNQVKSGAIEDNVTNFRQIMNDTMQAIAQGKAPETRVVKDVKGILGGLIKTTIEKEERTGKFTDIGKTKNTPSDLSEKDLEAYNWAIKNKDDSRARAILKRLNIEG